MQRSRNVILSLLLLYLFWGFNWVVMRTATDYFSPALYVVLRFAVGAAVLLVICAIRGQLVPPRQYMKWIAVTGLLSIAGNNLLIQTAIPYLGAGLTSVLNYTQSVFVCILAAVFLKERFTVRKGAGIVLCAIGLLILMNIETTGPLWAIPVALGSAALWGTSSVIVKTKLTRCNMLQMTAWQMTFATAAMIVYLVIRPPELMVWTRISVGAVLYSGLLASALSFFLFNYLLTHMEAGKVSVAIMAVPAVGVLSGIIVLHEPMTIKTALGMALLMAGVLLVLSNKQSLDHSE